MSQPFFCIGDDQSPALPETLATAYNAGMCLFALAVIRSYSNRRQRFIKAIEKIDIFFYDLTQAFAISHYYSHVSVRFGIVSVSSQGFQSDKSARKDPRRTSLGELVTNAIIVVVLMRISFITFKDF